MSACRSAVIFQGCRLHCLEQAHIYVSWHTRSAVIFKAVGWTAWSGEQYMSADPLEAG